LDTHAKTDALDHLILPLEAGLIDLPRVHCPESSVAKLRNGNPALVMGDVEYGEECWADTRAKPLPSARSNQASFTQRGYSCAPNRFLVT
jgi:tRNA pseudouridine55 synthase